MAVGLGGLVVRHGGGAWWWSIVGGQAWSVVNHEVCGMHIVCGEAW